MNLLFDKALTVGYKSNAQKIRVMSESWVEKNIFCPCCGYLHLSGLRNNAPVADFQCEDCGEIFELKSKSGSLGGKITDGAYDTMLERITSATNPELLVLNYSEQYSVVNLILIPKFFFVPSVIEKRKPLAPTARRAGWTGCNILLDKIPAPGRIGIITNQIVADAQQIVKRYEQLKQLQMQDVNKRGWLFDVLECVNDISAESFSLKDIYGYAELLKHKHPDNNNIEPKIRQQLQLLRDRGAIEFLARGQYRKNPLIFKL